MQSTSDLLFSLRSLLARTYGERRDPGLKLAYKLGSIKAATMISNGQGPNLDDKNTSKDISTLIEASTSLWNFDRWCGGDRWLF